MTELPGGARLVRLGTFTDDRGTLHVAPHGDEDLPFPVERVFVITGVPAGGTRGEHASRTTHELLIATSGCVAVELDDGDARATVVLDRPDVALHIPPLVWNVEVYGSGAVLTVLASNRFDPADHIEDHDELRLLARSARSARSAPG